MGLENKLDEEKLKTAQANAKVKAEKDARKTSEK
jgi:hypothetical protein